MYQQDENITRTRPYYLSFFKGIAVGFFALLLKLTVSFSTWRTYAGDSMFGKLDNYVIYIICFVASLLVYNSVIGLSMTYDITDRDELMSATHDQKGELPSFKGIFFYKSFLFELIGIVVLLSVSALLGGAAEIFGMFYLGEGYAPYTSGILPALITALIAFLLTVWARFEAVRYWKLLYRTANLELVESKTRLILRILFITILYPIALPYLPALAYAVVTILGLIGSLAISMTIPIFILTVVLIISGIWWLKILIAFNKRRKFFGELESSALMMKFEIADIKNPYLSLLSSKKKCTFTLVGKEKRFDCLMLGNARYRVPICFSTEREGYYRHRIGTQRYNITYRTPFDYHIDGEGSKILIICPDAKDVYIVEDDKERRLFNADKLWDCVAYESDAFIASFKRDCLGRYDSYNA